MALNANSSALHLNLPSGGSSTSRPSPPSLITLHPSVLAQIIDHHTRQSTPTTSRVIGTLLGHHHPQELEIRSAFAVPHSEDEEQVAIDMDYYKGMLELQGRLGGKGKSAGGEMGGAQAGEVIVGWYSSSPSLTPYSALIQNFFSQECASASPSSAAFGAVHLCVDLEGKGSGGLGVKGYYSLQVGNNPKPENCVFVPIPVALKYNMSEQAGLDLLLPTTTSKPAPDPSLPPLATLSNSLSLLSTQLTQIQTYVTAVNYGHTEGDEAVGRYLLDAVGRWKADGLSGKDEEGVKEDVRELLSVSYLSALVRSQVELSGRLGLLA